MLVPQCVEPTKNVKELRWQENGDRLIVVSQTVIVPRCDIGPQHFAMDELR